MSSGWLTWRWYIIRMSYGKFIMSSGWHALPFCVIRMNWGWFLIRSYGSVIMSSGWNTLPFLSHPDEIANFDFPHHAVALQRFRITRSHPNCVSNLYRFTWYEGNDKTPGWLYIYIYIYILLQICYMLINSKCKILQTFVPDFMYVSSALKIWNRASNNELFQVWAHTRSLLKHRLIVS